MKNEPKLTEDKVIELLKRYKAGETAIKLSKEYGIHQASVSYLVRKAGVQRKKGYNWERIREAVVDEDGNNA